MQDARQSIRFVPLKKNSPLHVASSNPLIAVINDKDYYRVQYGNRHITRLLPEYFEYDDSLKGIDMMVDGEPRFVAFGSHVQVHDHFQVNELPDYRVNIIGYYGKSGRDEDGELISYHDIIKQFSIDKAARRFRVEVYTEQRYCGMVIVDFRGEPIASENHRKHIVQENTDSNT